MPKVWTEDDDAVLSQMWRAGVSARSIGERLNVTRHSIVGRARRIGLPRHPMAKPGKGEGEMPQRGSVIPASIRNEGCQWIHGDPRGEHHKCGKPIAHHRFSFCEVHYAKAFRKPSAQISEQEGFRGRSHFRFGEGS